ncbi:MAG TPA: tripartite tricarboxylate transporter permease, partial [Acidocella sp.]
AKYLSKVTIIKANILVPLVISISVLGSWAVNQNIGNIVVSLVFAILGYVITAIEYPRLPLVISLILGGEIERYYDQSIMISGGTPRIFLQDPVSMFLLSVIVIAILYLPASFLVRRLLKRDKQIANAA